MASLNPLTTLVPLVLLHGFDPFIKESSRDRSESRKQSYLDKEAKRREEYNKTHFGGNDDI